MTLLLKILHYAWAAPCTAVGLVPTTVALLTGGSAWIRSGVIEVALSGTARASRIPFGAITLGHVILGRNARMLEELRPHERVHVRQYEHWGPFFFLAYPASSLYQVLRGRNPYWFNHFEVQCRERCAAASPPPDTESAI